MILPAGIRRPSDLVPSDCRNAVLHQTVHGAENTEIHNLPLLHLQQTLNRSIPILQHYNKH